LHCDVYECALQKVWSALREADDGAGSQYPNRRAIVVPHANLFGGGIPSGLKLVDECLTLRLVEVEIPGSVLEHFITAIKPKDARTRLIAIDDLAFRRGQNNSSNVPFEQYLITLSPGVCFFLARRYLHIDSNE
jgi:hypothetical protein